MSYVVRLILPFLLDYLYKRYVKKLPEWEEFPYAPAPLSTPPLLVKGFAIMPQHRLHTLDTLKSEYDAVLKLARDRGLSLARHPDVDKLRDDDKEDLEFLENLIARIREDFLMVPPPRGRGR